MPSVPVAPFPNRPARCAMASANDRRPIAREPFDEPGGANRARSRPNAPRYGREAVVQRRVREQAVADTIG